MKHKLYIMDNLDFLKNYQGKKFDIVYIDPPYNTKNKFKYNDKNKNWYSDIETRIKLLKNIIKPNTPVIVSISEDSLFYMYDILKKNFKYVFEPFVWQTKNCYNQNKTSNISAICHEYILIACDNNIKTNEEIYYLDKNYNDEEIQKIINLKKKRYNLKIHLKKDLEKYETITIDGKDIVIIPENEYLISKDIDIKKSFKNHLYQKRTIQKGHGSFRYYQTIKKIPDFNENTLYFIKNVKDKYNLNGKFLLKNNYFQSIGNYVKVKIPSFLGYYQPGIKNFQTAKPIKLMERILKAFKLKETTTLLDLYGGSGNVVIAANNISLETTTIEKGLDNEEYPGKFITENLKKNNINFKVINGKN